MAKLSRREARIKRHQRARKKIVGTPENLDFAFIKVLIIFTHKLSMIRLVEP